MRNCRAFTLIELLIVVAIIAILAAIAVPNFLEAQVRAKVSRAQNDMRSIATALESYRIDTNKYPPDSISGEWGWSDVGVHTHFGLRLLTTPIAYLTSVPNAPFMDRSNPSRVNQFYYRYFTEDGWKNLQSSFNQPDRIDEGYLWVLVSHGPDNLTSFGEYALFSQAWLNTIEPHFGGTAGCYYDATNGTISDGDIIRVGP